MWLAARLKPCPFKTGPASSFSAACGGQFLSPAKAGWRNLHCSHPRLAPWGYRLSPAEAGWRIVLAEPDFRQGISVAGNHVLPKNRATSVMSVVMR
jgi:hypothetical protein